LGDTFTFKRVDTSVFDQITEETKAYLSGQLDPHIVSTGTYVSDELVPVIRQYRSFDEKPAAAAPDKPGGKPA
jgi:hypothetical protein